MEFMWDKIEARNALNGLIDITAEFGKDIVGVLFDDSTDTGHTETGDATEDEDLEDEAGTGENLWDVLFREINVVLEKGETQPEAQAEACQEKRDGKEDANAQ